MYSVHAGTLSQADRKPYITVTPNVSITNNASESSDFEDNDKVMEALFREIVTSPCTTQEATTEGCEVSTSGSESAKVMVGYGDETDSRWKMGDCPVRATEGTDHTSFVDKDAEFRNHFYEEWTTEMETERMLDEIIAMTGSVDGGEAFANAEYSQIGVGPGLGLHLGVSTLSGWDMDSAVGCTGAH